MNISEANALNRLFDYLFQQIGTEEKAKAAAVWLADRAQSALHAGLSGQDVGALWPGFSGEKVVEEST